MIEIDKVEYLGDGLYAKFDGYQVWLLANSATSPTDKVALDNHTLDSFKRYLDRLYAPAVEIDDEALPSFGSPD
jgi:hypothetical protein